ncbi:hypothetical protein FRC09_017304 [Ceratobasidium sp. 395]|nr:hypothetical protein FRC09_017304 [Ceratobasidium sp. 395]
MSSASSGPKRAHRPGGRDRRSEPIEVRMSKTLSYILRHGAAKEGLAIRSDGYVRVTDLLARPKLKELDLPGLFKIVEADQKQRYQLGAQASSNEPIVPIPKTQVPDSTDVLWIRANQGHTLKVKWFILWLQFAKIDLLARLEVDDLELKPVAAPTEVQCAVHGTTLEAWQHIKSQGLSRMQRNHIHLASGRPGESGVISGMRVSSRVLIFIDIQAAMATGISFYLSSNGVILTTGDDSGFIPPEFFSSVEQRTDSGWEPIIVSGKSAELGTGEDI